MSLYNFVENSIKECPELLLLSNNKTSMNYLTLYNFCKNRQRKYPIQSFLDALLYDTICRCSTNIVEYELLKEKTRKIAALLQVKFDLNLSKIMTENH